MSQNENHIPVIDCTVQPDDAATLLAEHLNRHDVKFKVGIKSPMAQPTLFKHLLAAETGAKEGTDAPILAHHLQSALVKENVDISIYEAEDIIRHFILNKPVDEI